MKKIAKIFSLLAYAAAAVCFMVGFLREQSVWSIYAALAVLAGGAVQILAEKFL